MTDIQELECQLVNNFYPYSETFITELNLNYESEYSKNREQLHKGLKIYLAMVSNRFNIQHICLSTDYDYENKFLYVYFQGAPYTLIFTSLWYYSILDMIYDHNIVMKRQQEISYR